MTTSTPSTFLEAIERGPLLCDGAMGTLLYGYGVSLEHCLDETNLSQPALVLRAHSEYLAAGAQIVETNTFGANRVKLEENDIAGQAAEINAAGARLARQAVALSGRPTLDKRRNAAAPAPSRRKSPIDDSRLP